PFLSASLNAQSLVTLLALIGLGAIYNLTLLIIILPRKPAWLTSGYISAIGDTLLVTGGVAVTGGLAGPLPSPAFLAYFVVTVTTAVRFGGLAAIVAVLTIALSYTAVVYYGNTVLGTALTPNDLTNLAMRTGFVALTGIFVGFVGDRARRAERALQEELERAHASLSEVTVELNRDLEFEQTCQLTAEKGRSLLNADAFLMQVQMPPLIGQDESMPPASMLYVDWTAELKEHHAGVDLTTARLALTPAVGEQVIAVSDPNLLLPNEHKPLPAGMWFRIPVFHGARAIADMIVGFMGREQPLRQTEQELMLTFAERAGIAMRNAHALDQAQKLSVTDSVTGLPNHRYFHTRFDEEMEKTKDTGGSITVMMIDLDRFKVYNDSLRRGVESRGATDFIHHATRGHRDAIRRRGVRRHPPRRRHPDRADPGAGDLRHALQSLHVQPQDDLRAAHSLGRVGNLPGRCPQPRRAAEPSGPRHVHGEEARPQLHLWRLRAGKRRRLGLGPQ